MESDESEGGPTSPTVPVEEVGEKKTQKVTKKKTLKSDPKKPLPTSIVATHLPKDLTKREIEGLFSEIGQIRRCHLVRDKDWQFRGMVYVQYASAEAAAKAQKVLNRRQVQGSALKVKFSRNQKKDEKKAKAKKRKEEYLQRLKDEHFDGEVKESIQRKKLKAKNKFAAKKEARKKRKGRIIIRNLSFKVDEKLLQEHFSPYGNISEVKIMRKEDGKKMAGYAFLQYDTKEEAMKAIEECNMKDLLGRPVIVDLAVPKNQFETQVPVIKVEEDEDDIKEEKVDVKEEKWTGEGSTPASRSFQFDYSDVKVKEEVKSDEEDNDSGLVDKASDSEQSEDESDDDDDDDDDEEEESDAEEKSKQRKKSVSTNSPSKDIAEQRTVFIKNLSFDATEEDVSAVLSKFGELKYVILCIDSLTEHPRGTAFAQFKERESVAACLAAESDPLTKEQFIVLGRPMHVMKAISRGNLEEQRTKNSDKKGKDKRNLYLAREGFIRPGTKAAVGVSQDDMNVRQMRERVKRRMLKNFNIFLSTTRLCINNLPEKFSDDDLWRLFLKHGEPGCKITEARIMRNLREIGDDGKPKSRGYGFVNFTKHEHALAALRKLNNNPSIFTNLKRPVLEFSLENREILQAREKRLQRSREKNPLWNKGKKVDKSQKENKGQGNQLSGDSNDNPEASYMGSKGDPNAGADKALTASTGAKVRQRGKITRNQLKKQRMEKKSKKRIRVLDGSEEPALKKAKEEAQKEGITTKTKKKKKTNITKAMRADFKNDKSFSDMVKNYKQKMTANAGSSNKRWYED